jgi:hypothetical protein
MIYKVFKNVLFEYEIDTDTLLDATKIVNDYDDFINESHAYNYYYSPAFCLQGKMAEEEEKPVMNQYLVSFEREARVREERVVNASSPEEALTLIEEDQSTGEFSDCEIYEDGDLIGVCGTRFLRVLED